MAEHQAYILAVPGSNPGMPTKAIDQELPSLLKTLG